MSLLDQVNCVTADGLFLDGLMGIKTVSRRHLSDLSEVNDPENYIYDPRVSMSGKFFVWKYSETDNAFRERIQNER